MLTVKGMVYTKDCVFVPGTLEIEGDRIKEVRLCEASQLTDEERGQYLIPGLVDVHFHGAAGYDFCDGTLEALQEIETYENSHGITSICPATMTLPIEELENIMKTAAGSGLSSLKGIHLEGPFISKEKKGAQKEDHIIPANRAVLQKLQELAGGLIKIVSIAPETEGAIDCIAALKDEFCFSIAHTTADYETAVRAIEAGARHVTHLYNAMPTSTHREPSVLGAAADYAWDCAAGSHAAAERPVVDVELICDGIHVHPSVVRNTFRIFGADRVILISDSMRAAGMEDGNYTLGGQDVKVEGVYTPTGYAGKVEAGYTQGSQDGKRKGTIATLADGTIAGSVTNLFDCMKMAVSMGIPKESAIKAATINPARSIGIANIAGSLEAGKLADVLVVDKNLNLQRVIMGGR